MTDEREVLSRRRKDDIVQRLWTVWTTTSSMHLCVSVMRANVEKDWRLTLGHSMGTGVAGWVRKAVAPLTGPPWNSRSVSRV